MLPALSIVFLDGQLLIVHQLPVCCLYMFLNFLFNHAKKLTLEGSAWSGRFNLSSLSLFSFSELNKALDTNYKQVQLMKGSNFPSTRTTNSVQLILGWQYSMAIQHFYMYSFLRITSNEPICFEGWNKFSVPIWSPWEPILTCRGQLSLTEGESDFFHLPVFFFGVSSAWTQWSPTQHPQKLGTAQLGLLSNSFYFWNVIFQPMVFPFVYA